MDTSTVVIHLIGALSATTVMHAAYSAVTRKIAARKGEAEIESIGAKLGIPIDELQNPEHQTRIRDEALSRCSSELLRNRLSDAAGSVLRLAVVLLWIAEVAVIVAAAAHIWDSSNEAILMLWAIPFIYMIYLLFFSVFSFLCLLFTGRMPSQARMTRRAFGYRR